MRSKRYRRVPLFCATLYIQTEYVRINLHTTHPTTATESATVALSNASIGLKGRMDWGAVCWVHPGKYFRESVGKYFKRWSRIWKSEREDKEGIILFIYFRSDPEPVDDKTFFSISMYCGHSCISNSTTQLYYILFNSIKTPDVRSLHFSSTTADHRSSSMRFDVYDNSSDENETSWWRFRFFRRQSRAYTVSCRDSQQNGWNGRIKILAKGYLIIQWTIRVSIHNKWNQIMGVDVHFRDRFFKFNGYTSYDYVVYFLRRMHLLLNAETHRAACFDCAAK